MKQGREDAMSHYETLTLENVKIMNHTSSAGDHSSERNDLRLVNSKSRWDADYFKFNGHKE